MARDSVVRAAHVCTRMTAALDRAQWLRVRLRLVVSDGQGRVTDPKILDGTLSDATARACILGAFSSARWQTDASDRDLLFEIQVTLDELSR
jgi:hypothetical protein